MNSENRHRRHRRSRQPPTDRPRRSRSRRRHRSRSSSHYKRDRRRERSSSRHNSRHGSRRRRSRREEPDGAAYVSDSNDERKRDKWWGDCAGKCGEAAAARYYSRSRSLSSSYDRRRHRRRRRSSDGRRSSGDGGRSSRCSTERVKHSSTGRSSRDDRGRRRRGKKGQRRSRSRTPRSYDYESRGRGEGDDSGRKRKRAEKGGKRREGRRRRSSGNQSDSSHDDTVGHFKGGPGSFIGDQYRIVRDVGLGTFGRVVECSRLDNSRVAIKIVRNVRRYYDSALIEADICERVNREQRRQNKEFCAKLLDRFGLPSGHYCLVFERLGRSLYDYLKMNNYRPFPMFCVRDFSRQLLQALDFLHEFGLIHTDLKPENILLCHDDHGTNDVPLSTQVKVIDFGGATFDNEKKSSIVNTRQYRAPEVILGYPTWSYPSDLWSAGCIIAELYTGHLLFQTHDNAEHLALMEHACGKFRRDLLERATSPLARECFDSRGWHRLRGVLSSRSAEHVRKTKPIERLVLEHDRPTGLTELLRSLLMLDPMERATARQALGCGFLVSGIR